MEEVEPALLADAGSEVAVLAGVDVEHARRLTGRSGALEHRDLPPTFQL
jgi:hypothetical protein